VVPTVTLLPQRCAAEPQWCGASPRRAVGLGSGGAQRGVRQKVGARGVGGASSGVRVCAAKVNRVCVRVKVNKSPGHHLWGACVVCMGNNNDN